MTREPRRVRRTMALSVAALTIVVAAGCTQPPPNSTYPLVAFVGWTKVSGSAPPSRWGHVAAYDRSRKRMLIWGGTDAGVFRNDLWALDLDTKTWTQLNAPGGPSARYTSAAFVDDARDRMIVTGGSDGGQAFADAWALNLATLTWTQLPGAPTARYDAAATTDGTKAWVFAGFSTSNHATDDLWEMDLATNAWKQLPAAARPTPTTNLAIAKLGNGLLITGGHADHDVVTPGTWRYDFTAATWTQQAEANVPAGQAHQAYATDPTCGLLLLFGGDRANRIDTNELLVVEPGPPTSFFSMGALTPPRRRHSSLIFDPDQRRVAIFGGIQADGPILDDTWIADLPACAP